MTFALTTTFGRKILKKPEHANAPDDKICQASVSCVFSHTVFVGLCAKCPRHSACHQTSRLSFRFCGFQYTFLTWPDGGGSGVMRVSYCGTFSPRFWHSCVWPCYHQRRSAMLSARAFSTKDIFSFPRVVSLCTTVRWVRQLLTRLGFAKSPGSDETEPRAKRSIVQTSIELVSHDICRQLVGSYFYLNVFACALPLSSLFVRIEPAER